MQTFAERILHLIRERAGLSDREIADVLLGRDKHQAQVNQECRLLERRGSILRLKYGTSPIRNFLPDQPREEFSRAEKVVRDSRVPASYAPFQYHGSKKRVMLLGCVKSKSTSAESAKDLYLSTLWSRRKRYVEKTCEEWYVISTEYGLVSPNEVIEPYENTLKDKSASYRREWSQNVVAKLKTKFGSLAAVHFEIHAGREYYEQLVQLLAREGASAEVPVAHLRRGEQVAWYDAQVRHLRNG